MPTTQSAHPTGLKPGYKTRGHRWEGVLKDETGRITWTCGHSHLNRDHGSRLHGPSAVECAKEYRSRVRGMLEAAA